MAVYGTALYNAGICYSRLGEFDRALGVQHRAVQFHEKRGASRQLVESLGSLGTTHGLSGQPGEALPFFQRALVAGHHSEPDRRRSAVGRKSRDRVYGAGPTGTKLSASTVRRCALPLANPSIKPVYFTLNAAHIALGRGALDQAKSLYEDGLAKAAGTPAVEWSAHAGLARVGTSAGQPEQAARHFEAALQTIEKTRSSLLRTEFKLSFLTQLIEFYQTYVDALVNQKSHRKSARDRRIESRPRAGRAARSPVDTES